jgi:hypothetical protein
MADLPIALLPEITAITRDTLYVVSEGGTTYKVKAGNTSGDAAIGVFQSSVDQTITGTTSESYVVQMEQSFVSYGVEVVDNSKITVLSAGTYNLAFSLQLEKISGAGSYTISIWSRINGIDVPDSTGDIVLAGTPLVSPTIASWSLLNILNAGDYVELVWSSDNTNVKLYAIPERINPVRPASPSVAITMSEL